MKFKDKDGNVFEKIEDALKKYCQSRKCPNCVIEKRTLQTKLYACSSFCNAHPAEAARLMGYEVVEEDTPTKSTNTPTNMPIKKGDRGPEGPPGMCPECGFFSGITWDSKTDVSTCKCGWTSRTHRRRDKP